MQYRFLDIEISDKTADEVCGGARYDSDDTSDQLRETMIGFYKLGKLFAEMNGDDPGVVMPGWIDNDRSANFVDRFTMFAEAATAFWRSRSGQPDNVTVFVLNGLLKDNYYVMFSDKRSKDQQELDILVQLKNISANLAKRIIQQTWDENKPKEIFD